MVAKAKPKKFTAEEYAVGHAVAVAVDDIDIRWDIFAPHTAAFLKELRKHGFDVIRRKK